MYPKKIIIGGLSLLLLSSSAMHCMKKLTIEEIKEKRDTNSKIMTLKDDLRALEEKVKSGAVLTKAQKNDVQDRFDALKGKMDQASIEYIKEKQDIISGKKKVPAKQTGTQPAIGTTTQPTTKTWKLPPAKPTTTQPVQPTQPAKPTVTQPVQPTVTQPIKPTVTQPVKPTVTQPVQPTVTQPVQPTVTQPVEPTVTQPVQPTVTQPAKPTTTDEELIAPDATKLEIKPVKPTVTKPVTTATQPTTTQPTTTQPTTTQPTTTQPTTTQPRDPKDILREEIAKRKKQMQGDEDTQENDQGPEGEW